MATLYYGGGDCSVQGNVSSLAIYYQGAIVIKSKLPDGYNIITGNGKLNISTTGRTQNLNDLFSYIGYFKIKSVTANNLEGDKEPVSISRVMDFTELLNSKVEDLTVKTEDMKVTYKVGRTFRKTSVIKKLERGKV